MGVVKTLEKKSVIRAFGVILFLSPFMNTLLSMSMQKAVKNKWTMDQMWRVIDTSNTTSNVLMVGSILLGMVMMSGSTKAWKFTLALLGGFIAVQLKRLDYDVHVHWIYGVMFLINVGAFAYIADQLVFKQKFDNLPPSLQPIPKPVAKSPAEIPKETPIQKENIFPLEKPLPKTAKNTVLVAFEKQAPWAKLLSISTQGVEVKALSSPPAGMENREIEMNLGQGLPLRLRLLKSSEQVFFFEFRDLKSDQIHTINSWLKQKSQAA
jgi:hypothetical protein